MRKTKAMIFSCIVLLCLATLAACIGKSNKADSLTIYTSMKESLIEALVLDFTARHPGIEVSVTIDGAGGLMRRIEAEAQREPSAPI